MLVKLLLFLATFILTVEYVIVKQVAEDIFQSKFQLHDSVSMKTHLLIVSCKQSQVLSLMVLPLGKSSQENPRYQVFRPQQTHGLNKPGYTFLNNCRVDLDFKDRQSLVVVRRKNSTDVLFEIKKVTFGLGHNIFETIDNSQIFGLGERFQQHFDVRDGTWALWNRDRPWEIDAGSSTKAAQTYGFQPVYLARESVSKLFHITYFKTVYAMNVEKQKQKIVYNVVDGNAHFLIFIGTQNPEALLQKYHRYIGPSFIPPFWSFGYHQCRWGYKNIEDLEYIVQMHDKHSVPLDVVWNDLDYMHQKQDFTVNEELFPLARMKNNILSTVHYVPLIDAGISVDSVDIYKKGNDKNVYMKLNGKNYLGRVWPGHTSFVDFLHPNASSYWNQVFDILHDKIPFSGVWIDMNQIANFDGFTPTNQTYRVQHSESLNMMTADIKCSHFNKDNFIQPYQHYEVHTYYGHLMVQATNSYLKKKGMRPFILTRSNSVGTGVYGAHWTGDNVANWKFLRLSISGNFLFQIFGIHMVGADICGFHLDTTEELCSRWMQIGAFYPFARNHNEEKYISQQVYALGDKHLRTSKLSLDLRYSLLKQYYTVYVRSQGTGSIYRPLIFEFPSDEQCYAEDVLEQQFMIGDILMGVPIVRQHQTSKEGYFPGGWYNYVTGEINRGKKVVENILPAAPSIFVRQGKVVFVNKPQTRTKNLDNNFTIKIGLKNENQTGHSLAEGEILSITDYENNENIDKCTKRGCFYKLKVIMIEEGKVEISWVYSGEEGLSSKIFIDNIEIFRDGKVPIVRSVAITLEGNGSFVVNL